MQARDPGVVAVVADLPDEAGLHVPHSNVPLDLPLGGKHRRCCRCEARHFRFQSPSGMFLT
jgi:hypothetical protein